MIRTVPETTSEGIELYIRTYYSLLRSSGDVRIRSLEETHEGMKSSLHLEAESQVFDTSAFIYAAMRLPACIYEIRRIFMGQSEDVFMRGGLRDIADWQRVDAPARRRRMMFNGEDMLAAFVSSVSDIDDLIPSLTAYQIEWNKAHQKLYNSRIVDQLAACASTRSGLDEVLRQDIRDVLDLSEEDLGRLEAVWRGDTAETLLAMARQRKRFAVRLLSGAHVDYRRAIKGWWQHITSSIQTPLGDRAVYFVSSNPHSLVNLLVGYPLRQEEDLIRFVETGEDPDLLEEYRSIQQEEVPSNRENFLYYVAKKYHATAAGKPSRFACIAELYGSGVTHVESAHHLDVEAQVIELCALRPEWMDPRIRMDGLELLTDSDAVILNIDYPLGLAEYHILTEITSGIGDLRGLYIQGKAATLNGRVGDVMVPGVVHDEDSKNTYLFHNAFTASDVNRYLIYGTVLDNQKAISVWGTFLQNREYMDVFYREGFTDIEMEAGPYLSAIYEAIEPERYPVNEIIDLHRAPFEIGILHYASDTPFTRGRTLGRHLSYYGMDPTYACSVAIVRRILELEIRAVKQGVGRRNAAHRR